MTATIYYSNRLEKLAEKLAKKMRHPAGGVFTRATIITQTKGMEHWLTAELAKKEKLGIFANFSILNQDAFLDELYFLLAGKHIRNNKLSNKWLIYGLLGREGFLLNKDFKSAVDYYKDDDLKRFQLAARVNDLFDQYQVYRENIIAEWEDGRLHNPGSIPEKWQKWLWTKLREENLIFPKYQLKKDLIKAFKEEQFRELIKASFPRISFFGNSVYTLFHQEIFSELAGVTEVDHYFSGAAKSMSGKSQFKNEILESLGNQSLETWTILSEKADIIDLSESPGNQSFLDKVQLNMFTDTDAEHAPVIRNEDLEDKSILINSAYTPAREVEILYNYLLDLMSTDSTLNPRDILVLARDIDSYAPFIEAVFSNAPYSIPWKITGVSRNQKESVLTALMSILEFDEEDFTSEKIISLLETKLIAAKYEIKETSGIRSLIRKANIRFGRKNRQEDDTVFVSWDYGLKKLAYGYAMLTDQSYHLPSENLSLYPFGDIEGEGGRQIMRVKAFTDDLCRVIDGKKGTKSLDDWINFTLEEVLDKCIFEDPAEENNLAFLYRKLDKLRDIIDIVPGLMLDFKVFYEQLKKVLLEDPVYFGFNSGKLTFSSFDEAKGIPARVLAFIGLNGNNFPRKDRFVSYDLIGKEYLPGDRSVLGNDKQKFLDTMLSARDCLYLSYIGHSSKDNSILPPSIVIDELLDYCERISEQPEKVRKVLVAEHPLHGFSTKYKQDNPRMFTYFQGIRNNTNEIFNEEKDTGELSSLNEINLDHLLYFYKSPIKWYYQTFVGLYLEEEEDKQLSEKEVFELDNLELWNLRNELLRNDLNDNELLELIRDEYIKSGLLPLKNFSIISMDAIRKEVIPVKNKIDSLSKGIQPRTASHIIKLENGCTLSGSVGNIYADKHIAFSFSKKPLKYEVEAWIRHLFLTAAGESVSSIFLNHKGTVKALRQIDRETAKAHLKALTDYFIRGNREITLVTLDGAASYFKNGDYNKALDTITEEGTYHKYNNKFPDLYITRALQDNQFEDRENFEKHLKDLSPALLSY